MPAIEISALEFDELCCKVVDLWKQKKDTAQMAKILNVSEAKIVHVLYYFREAMHDAKEEDMESVTNGDRADAGPE